jgi:hypothetical protein
MALSRCGGPARILGLAVQPGVILTDCDGLEWNELGVFGVT